MDPTAFTDLGGATVKSRVLLLTAAVMLSMTACGGSDKDAGPPKVATSSATPKPTTGTLLDNVPAAPPERPKDVRSKAGAIDFAEFVVDTYFYVLATNDISPLSIADANLCTECKEMRTSIEKRADRVWIGDEPHKISGARVDFEEGAFYTVRQKVHFSTGGEVDKYTGKLLGKLDASNDNTGVKLEWRGDKWVLLDISFEEVKS